MGGITSDLGLSKWLVRTLDLGLSKRTVITSDLRLSKWRLSHQIWGQNGSYHIRSEVKMMVITSDLRLSKWMVITSDLRSKWMVITSDLQLSKWPSHQIWGCQDEWSSHHIITEVVKVATSHIRCAWDDGGPPLCIRFGAVTMAYL